MNNKILNNKKNENDKKEEYNVDNLKLDLDEKDLEEFKQFAPTLLIYKGKKIYSFENKF